MTIELLAKKLSLNKQLDLLTSGLTGLLNNDPNIYKVILRPKPKSIYIDIETSGKYIYDRSTGLVYSISAYGQKNRSLGSVADVINKLDAENDNCIRNIQLRKGIARSEVIEQLPEPSGLVQREKKFEPPGVREGAIFRATWGYDMIHNEYVMVIKDNPKTVKVVKLENQKLTGAPYWQQGTEKPTTTNLGDALALARYDKKRVFLLKKEFDKQYGVILRGADKSMGFDTVRFWTPWNGKPNSYDYMD